MYPKTYFEQNSPDLKIGNCFVLMPFAEKYADVYQAIEEGIEGTELNFTCTRADELFGGGHIIEDILKCIGEAEIIIADLTTKNPNVFYELGIAHTVKSLEKVLIITQTMDDVPFDLQHFRCLRYTQSSTGLRALQRDIIAAVKEVSNPVYRLSVRNNEGYRFPHGLMGSDRGSYDFEFLEIWVEIGFAKFRMKENRHALGKEPQVVSDNIYALALGETVNLTGTPWQLILDETRDDTAFFRVIKII